MAPEDNPADDVQPTKEEWNDFEDDDDDDEDEWDDYDFDDDDDY